MPRERRGAPSCGSTATRTCVAYTSGSDSPTSTLSIPAGIQPSSQNAWNSKSNVRSGIEVHVGVGRARGFKITCSPTAMSWLRERLSISSTSIINPLDNAAAVIAADARAGLFGPVRLARPSACLGEISGGRINSGASPPFVRVKAEDSSLKTSVYEMQMSFSETTAPS